ELGPARVAGGDGVYGHHATVVGIRQKRTLVLRNPIANIEHIGAVSVLRIILLAKLEVGGEDGCITRFGESRKAERVPAIAGDGRISDDLVGSYRIIAADEILELDPPERTKAVDDAVADILLGDIGFHLRTE